MPKNRKPYGISGEPWHVEYLRMEGTDERRDKRRCKFFNKGNYCKKHIERCIGSSHCDDYQEKEAREITTHYLEEDGRYYKYTETMPNTAVRNISDFELKKSGQKVLSYEAYINRSVQCLSDKQFDYYPTGTKVHSAILGEGRIVSYDSNKVRVQFSEKISTFLTEALQNGQLTISPYARRSYIYQKEIYHPGLQAYQIIQEETKAALKQKTKAIVDSWELEWRKVTQAIQCNHTTDQFRKYANLRTQKCSEIRSILDSVYRYNKPFKDIQFEHEQIPEPVLIPEPKKPEYKQIPEQPSTENDKYAIKISFFQRLFKSKRIAAEAAARDKYLADFAVWEKEFDKIQKENDRITEQYEAEYTRWKNEQAAYYKAWNDRVLVSKQKAQRIADGDKKAVEEYFMDLLSSIEVPLYYHKEYRVIYDQHNSILTVGCNLPNFKAIPNIKRVVYRESENGFLEELFAEEEVKKHYDQIIYDILLTIAGYVYHTGYQRIQIKKLKIYGYVEMLNPADGRMITSKIVSVTTEYEDYQHAENNNLSGEQWVSSMKGTIRVPLWKGTPING